MHIHIVGKMVTGVTCEMVSQHIFVIFLVENILFGESDVECGVLPITSAGVDVIMHVRGGTPGVVGMSAPSRFAKAVNHNMANAFSDKHYDVGSIV